VLAVLSGGCQLAESEDDTADAVSEGMDEGGSTGPIESEDQSEQPDEGTASSESNQGDGGDELPADLRACTGEEADAISEVIGFQLDAFVASDFPAALSWATPGFRRSFTPQAFEEMITSSFPVPASATDHRVLDCTVSGGAAVTTVSIDGAGATQDFSYGLQLLDEGWRIDGAVPLSDVAPPAEVI
jgi:hypothetical protein